MTITNQSFTELTRFTELRRRLLEADPEIDERTLADTLEGATNLREAIACVVRSALDDEALANGLKLRLENMGERLERIETTAAKKRQVALAAMEEADIEKILEPDFTVSIRLNRLLSSLPVNQTSPKSSGCRSPQNSISAAFSKFSKSAAP